MSHASGWRATLWRGGARLANWGQARPRWTALLAGGLLPLGLAPFFILPLYYALWAVFFALIVTARRWQDAAVLGFCFGFGQFFTGLIWIGEAFLVEAENFLWALPFAITLLPAGLALFFAAAAAGAAALVTRAQLARLPALLVFVLAFSGAEWARAHALTGLPWNQPAQAWLGVLPLAQSGAWFGPHGTGLLVLLSAAALALGRRWAGVLAVAIPLLATTGGAVRLAQAPASEAAGLPVLLVQPNIDQRQKWRPELRRQHIDKVIKITAAGLQAAPQTRLVVWPETALPALLDEGTGFADLLRARLPRDKLILTGAVRRAPRPAGGYAHYNSAQLWRSDGRLLARSDKHHLVPFGEYLPLQNWLEALGLRQLTKLRGGYAAGPAHARLTAPGLPLLAPLICYEAIFPALSGGQPRPAALVNITNDGWFGTSIGPHQHLAQARARAIEQGLPLIRVANTGISTLIDGHGRASGTIGLGQTGVRLEPLPTALAPTLYSRFGELIYGLMLALMGAGLAVMVADRKRRKTD